MGAGLRLAERQGLKYPDDYLVRFFFKNGLHQKPGRALELGCGNGNNLQLLHEFDWQVTGIDFSAAELAAARHNLPAGRWLEHDLSAGFPPLEDSYDALLIPNVLNYLPRETVPELLRELARRASAGAFLFLRTRSLRDGRYGRGEPEGRDAFRLTLDETGEQGTLQTFYSETELVRLVRTCLAGYQLVVLETEFDNLQNGRRIHNADLIVWGRCR